MKGLESTHEIQMPYLERDGALRLQPTGTILSRSEIACG